MSPDFAVHLISQAFWTTVVLCAPLLLIGFAVGIVDNIIQIATSMQEPRAARQGELDYRA